jgi:hypothetical protein
VPQWAQTQAKKNVVSGKVFEAHEEVQRQQRDMESKEAHLAQLSAALQQHKAREAALESEVASLRQQLEAKQAAAAVAVAAPAAASADAASSGSAGAGVRALSARQRDSLHLPLGQMLAAQQQQQQQQQAAGKGPATSRSTAAEPQSARTPGASRYPSSSGAAAGVGSPRVGSAHAHAHAHAHGAAAAAHSPAASSASKIGRLRIDRNPARDQDECSLPVSVAGRARASRRGSSTVVSGG